MVENQIMSDFRKYVLDYKTNPKIMIEKSDKNEICIDKTKKSGFQKTLKDIFTKEIFQDPEQLKNFYELALFAVRDLVSSVIVEIPEGTAFPKIEDIIGELQNLGILPILEIPNYTFDCIDTGLRFKIPDNDAEITLIITDAEVLIPTGITISADMKIIKHKKRGLKVELSTNDSSTCLLLNCSSEEPFELEQLPPITP